MKPFFYTYLSNEYTFWITHFLVHFWSKKLKVRKWQQILLTRTLECFISACRRCATRAISISYLFVFVGWLVFFRINVDLAIFQPYLDLEAGDNQSLKIQVVRPGIEPGPLAPQAKSLTTRPPLLPVFVLVLFNVYLWILTPITCN